MAAYSHSRTLFIKETGRPVVFSIMPCEEKKRLRPLVEHGGGVLTSACREGSIRLAVPGTVVTEKDAISSDYVWDCVDQNRLLKMRDYRVRPGMQPARVPANDSDSELRPSTTIIPKKRDRVRGRQKYSLSEDMRIFSYIISEKVYNDVRGKAIWKQMQKIKLTDHTAESMRSHFLKSMIPRLDSYPIRDTWKQKFGYLPPENKNLPLPVYDTRPGNNYSSSDVEIEENEESEVEVTKASQRNSQERNSPGKRHGQNGSPQKQSTRSTSGADKVVNEDDVECVTESENDDHGKGGSNPSHKIQHEDHDEESYSGDSEDGNTNNNRNANSKRRRISSSDDEFLRARKERQDNRQRRSKDSNHQQTGRPVRRNGLDEPQPGPSNKRTASSSALLHTGSPRKTRRTRQHQEEEEDSTPDFPVSEEPQPSTSRQNTGPGNNNARVAAPRGSSTSKIGSVVETLCRDFDLSAKQAVQCLWVCSGSVEDAFHWLQHGKRRNGLEAWSKEEDQILRGADPKKTEGLEKKFGADDVSRRLVFLGI